MVNERVDNRSQHVVNALLTRFIHEKNFGLVLTTGCKRVDNGLSTVNNALTMGCQHITKTKKIQQRPLSTR